MNRALLVLLCATATTSATESDYKGSDAEMIRLREYLRLVDERDKRAETKAERRIERQYTLDIYGCPSNLEVEITEAVLHSFASDIGDSIISILFVEQGEFQQHTTRTAVAFAHYSNMVAVKKTNCNADGKAAPVVSYDLRSFLNHEIAHIRTFNIHNFEQLFPPEKWSGNGDLRTLKTKWKSLDGCRTVEVGKRWRALPKAPPGYVNRYAASDWMEDVASLVEYAQLPAFVGVLDHLALGRLHKAYQGSAQHKRCLESKLNKARAYRFLDPETAKLVLEVWKSASPTSPRLLAETRRVRKLVRSRNIKALSDRSGEPSQ